MLQDAPLIGFAATADGARARRFYEGTLGLRVISDDGFALALDAGGTMLRIQKVEHVHAAPYTALGWRVASLADAVDDLTARGVAFTRFPGLDQDARGLTLLSQGVNSIGVRPDQVASTNPAEVFVLENDANGAPARHSCVVRIVGTFGVDGPDGHGATEIRQNGNAAQGVDGFNVPSLLGVSMGGPYLHNGAAETLEELLDPTGDFGNHLRAGNQVFSPTDDELADLIAFLRSIDDGTDLFEVPADQSFCPNGLSFD